MHRRCRTKADACAAGSTSLAPGVSRRKQCRLRDAMKEHTTRLRVRYAETDQMGVVYYSNYLVWMELGRVEYCRAAGVSYGRMEREDSLLLTVAEAHCRYLAPAVYDEEVIVTTRIEQSGPRMVRFGYEMRREDGQPLAQGYTKHIFCGRDMRPRRLPEKYWAPLGIRRPAAGRNGLAGQSR